MSDQRREGKTPIRHPGPRCPCVACSKQRGELTSVTLAPAAQGCREALEEMLQTAVRLPDSQYRYSRCNHCNASWWDNEEHNLRCPVPHWRAALAACPPSAGSRKTPQELTVFLGFDEWPHSNGRLGFEHGQTIAASVTFEIRNGTAVYIIRPAAPRAAEAGQREDWTRAKDSHPPPHARYEVYRREVGTFVATPCYGMHQPWWVPLTADLYAPGAIHFPIQPDDRWRPWVTPEAGTEGG